jgi:hypothetical protein
MLIWPFSSISSPLEQLHAPPYSSQNRNKYDKSTDRSPYNRTNVTTLFTLVFLREKGPVGRIAIQISRRKISPRANAVVLARIR